MRVPVAASARCECHICYGDVVAICVDHVEVDVAAVEGWGVLDGGCALVLGRGEDCCRWHCRVAVVRRGEVCRRARKEIKYVLWIFNLLLGNSEMRQ